jgi:hypothetical protein
MNFLIGRFVAGMDTSSQTSVAPSTTLLAVQAKTLIGHYSGSAAVSVWSSRFDTVLEL